MDDDVCPVAVKVMFGNLTNALGRAATYSLISEIAALTAKMEGLEEYISAQEDHNADLLVASKKHYQAAGEHASRVSILEAEIATLRELLKSVFQHIRICEETIDLLDNIRAAIDAAGEDNHD